MQNQTVGLEMLLEIKFQPQKCYVRFADVKVKFSDGKKTLSLKPDGKIPFNLRAKIEEGSLSWGDMILAAYSQLYGREVNFTIFQDKIVFEKSKLIKRPRGLPEFALFPFIPFDLVEYEAQEIVGFVVGVKHLPYVNILFDSGYFEETIQHRQVQDKVIGESTLKLCKGKTCKIEKFESRGEIVFDKAVLSSSIWKSNMQVSHTYGPFTSEIKREVKLIKEVEDE
jgi:hypothetical protein